MHTLGWFVQNEINISQKCLEDMFSFCTFAEIWP